MLTCWRGRESAMLTAQTQIVGEVVGNVELIMVVHVVVMRWKVVMIVVMMRICSECMEVCRFTSVWGATAAAGSTWRVRRLWGVAWGSWGTRTEIIVVVIVAGSWTYAVSQLSLSMTGDVDRMCSSV